MKMNLRRRKWATAIAAGVLVALTGLSINAPAASAASVSGCKSSKTFSYSTGWAKISGAVARDCKVTSGSQTYYRQDFVSFTLRDTKCDRSGPRAYIYHGKVAIWNKYNSSGCDKSVTGTGWTNSAGKIWYVRMNSDKQGMTDYVKIS
ncbi:hypothetical protein [Nonomuraea turcica]|uniref:hypothetical protein n=1 Tax=Nonomuraea sp. G32 TaxID=3067274 RepID=UPI00273CEE1A|nr:hypothetical protein [Nonomuraea sp. G32]MDP4505908.1 hypothetical protein [Nonomuraea sp. G32]